MQVHRDVVVLDTHRSKLPQAMQELYLADLQAWVLAACRNVSATDKPIGNMLEGLFERTESTGGLVRWQWIGPHAAVRDTHRLSQDAVMILLLAAAPKLWGNFAYVYDAISSTSRGHADFNLLRRLLGDRIDLRRELSADSPLVAFGLVKVSATGAVSVTSDVVCRLAGH
jgi:hypothetical protein